MILIITIKPALQENYDELIIENSHFVLSSTLIAQIIINVRLIVFLLFFIAFLLFFPHIWGHILQPDRT